MPVIMKRTIFLSLIIALIIGSCTHQKKSPIEGAWQLVYGNWSDETGTFPAQIKGSDIKMWSKEYSTFVGHFQIDSLAQDIYGGGTYKLEGNRYEETLLYHYFKYFIGKKVKFLLEIQNDTLILNYPTDKNWNLAEKYSTEKYIRLK